MVTLHTGMIDDKNTQHTQKTHQTYTTQTIRRQNARSRHSTQTNTHRRHTMRIKYTQGNNTFYKRINISNTYKNLRIKKKGKYLPPFAMFTFYRK